MKCEVYFDNKVRSVLLYFEHFLKIVVKMTPPLSWHFLQDENGRIQMVKNGKKSENGYVTSVRCFENGGKTALRVSFTDLCSSACKTHQIIVVKNTIYASGNNKLGTNFNSKTGFLTSKIEFFPYLHFALA